MRLYRRSRRSVALAFLVPVSFGCGAGAGAPPNDPGCAAFGPRGFTLTVRASSSHALQFRELRYDDGRGELTVHDSDRFASGVESTTPRVLELTRALTADERDALAGELLGHCPTRADRIDVSELGGGATLLRVRRAGAASEDPDVFGVRVARPILRRLEAFFPELRTSP